MSIRQALANVQGGIGALAASLKLPSLPTLVAVSKTKPVAAVQEAYDAGQRSFGENYVQELVAKAPVLPKDIRWSFIGPLQTNKAKLLLTNVPWLYCVETVATVKLAKRLDKVCAALTRETPLKVLVQVNTSGEEAKSGVQPEECVNMVKFVAEECKALEFAGLMTIGRAGDDTGECFECLMKCREQVLEQLGKLGGVPAADDFVMSMGMSADHLLAIQMGSTSVRVGSSIFGARDYGTTGTAAQEPVAATPNKTVVDVTTGKPK